MTLNRSFAADTLSDLRHAVLAEAAAAGLPGDRAADVMIAVHELAANVVRHGAGSGQLVMRVRGGQLHCQVSDIGPARVDGPANRSALPTLSPWPVQSGHGLWLVRKAADHFSVTSGVAGSRVIAVFTLPAAPGQPTPHE